MTTLKTAEVRNGRMDFFLFILAFMNEDNEFKRVFFGVIQINRTMNSEGYDQFSREFPVHLRHGHAKPGEPLVPKVRESSGKLELVIASSQSDAGPGVSGSLTNRFSSQQDVLCVGVNGIQFDAVEFFTLVEKQLNVCRIMSKEVRKVNKNDSALLRSTARNPPGFRKVRWNTCFKLLGWVYANLQNDCSKVPEYRDLDRVTS